jgi:hypothetical protein
MQTPFYLKETTDERLPEDPVSYTLSRDGLFINRSGPLFSASVPCPHPRELARHEASLEWKHLIPQHIAEQAVGFFDAINRRQPGTEAVVLLGWDAWQGYELIIPEQNAIVARHAFGHPSPVRVRYEVPNLRPGVVLVGDIHSHSYIEAFSSDTDYWDTLQRTGLFLTVGRIDMPTEPPDMYATVVIDRYTFEVENPLDLFTGYGRRSNDIPEEWFSRVHVQEVPSSGFHTRQKANDPGRPIIHHES